MKRAPKVILVILILLFALFIGRNMLVKGLIETGVSVVTGLKLSIDKLDIGIFKTHVSIKGLKILNPKDFEEPTMLNMPEITIDYNLGDILKKNIHLESIVIKLQEFNVVKNKAGIVNLDSLKMVKEGKEKAPAKQKEKKPKEKTGKTSFQIDNLELAIGTISFKDFSGKTPKSNDFKFNINEQYENIKNPQVIIAIIINKALLKASAAKIGDFGLDSMNGLVSGTAANAKVVATEAFSITKDLATGTFSTTKDLGSSTLQAGKVVGETTLATAKDAADTTVDTAKAAAQTTLSGLKSSASSLKGLTDKLKLTD